MTVRNTRWKRKLIYCNQTRRTDDFFGGVCLLYVLQLQITTVNLRKLANKGGNWTGPEEQHNTCSFSSVLVFNKQSCICTCASLSPSSILSSDWRMMLHFSPSTLPPSNACRLSSRLQFSPLSASSPAITCCVLHRISSAGSMAATSLCNNCTENSRRIL